VALGFGGRNFVFDEEHNSPPVEGDLGFQFAGGFRYSLSVADPEKWEAAKDMIAQKRERPKDSYAVWNITDVGDAVLLEAHMWGVSTTVGFDFETKGWNPKALIVGYDGVTTKKMAPSPMHPKHHAVPVTFQVSWGNVGYVVDAGFLYLFIEYLCERAKLDIANANFELDVTRVMGVPMRRFERDVIHMDWLLEETIYDTNFRGRGLKSGLAPEYLGLACAEFESVFKDAEQYEPIWRDSPQGACEYAGLDPILTSWVGDVIETHLEGRLARDGYTAAELYQRVERGLQMSVIRMGQNGIGLRKSAVDAHAKSIQTRVDGLEGQVFAAAGREVNLKSPKDLIKLLFVDGDNPVQMTNAGQMCLMCGGKQVNARTGNQCLIHGVGGLVNSPGTDDTVMTALAESGNPIAELVQGHRTLSKERSTYIDGYTREMDGGDWGWPRFATSRVVSGRLAAGNYLTTPAHLRDIIGFDLDSKYKMVGGDYSQVEYRVLTVLSQDPTMIQGFQDGKDFHSSSGATILAYNEVGAKSFTDPSYAEKWHDIIEQARVDKKHKKLLSKVQKYALTGRAQGKTLNFSTVYGIGEDRIALRLGCTIEEARKIKNAVFSAYKLLGLYFEKTLAFAMEHGYVRTIGGRRKVLKELFSKFPSVVAEGERLSQNIPCQGGARDIITLAKIGVDVDLEAGGFYGTTGRGAYGTFRDGIWSPDWECLPKTWRANPPEPLFTSALGTLGKLKFCPSIECHDELQMFGPKENAEFARDRLRDLMMHPIGDEFEFNVPLKVDLKIGYTWMETK